MEREKIKVDLYETYKEAKRHKRNKAEVIEFEIEEQKSLYNLFELLIEKRYEPLPSKVFIVEKPVKREVFAAQFVDRIVHHLLVRYIGPIFERRMIDDSYSCRVGKGTLYGIKRMAKFMRQCSKNYREDAYVMKLDIEGYFMNIHRPTLLKIVKETLERYANELLTYVDKEWIKWLSEVIILHDPTKNCIYRSNKRAWQDLPRSKSLFYTPKDCGLPIGNLTSQLFANVYLNAMDWYIKKELRIRYYGRYVDDFCLMHKSKEYLLECREKIDDFLQVQLRLRLHSQKFYLQPIHVGVKFLGAYIKPYRIYVGKRIKTNLWQCIKSWNERINEKMKIDVYSMRSQIQSYFGMIKHFNTYRLQQKIIRSSHPIIQYYAISN
ncbi:MAG: RNA-directed DNA polymerase [Bacteroidales bacterium]|nr:RNA-directed DNA polymerase [Bacteroidales bacterium]